jgi:hypothetical protein
MACTHPRRAMVVLHNLASEEHSEGLDGTEASCACGPVLVCLICHADTLRDEALILAPADVVERLREAERPALLN